MQRESSTKSTKTTKSTSSSTAKKGKSRANLKKDTIPQDEEVVETVTKQVVETEEEEVVDIKKVEDHEVPITIEPVPDIEDEDEEEKKYSLNVKTPKGNALKVVFDMLYYLMPLELYLIMMQKGLYYSGADKDGYLVAQFVIDGERLEKYQVPKELKDPSQCHIVSMSTKDLQVSTKAKLKDHMQLYIENDDKRTLVVEVCNAKNVNPTKNKIPLGDDSKYKPIETPQYPEGLRPIVKINGKEFSEKCKSFSTFGDVVEISVQRKGMRMVAGAKDTRSTEPIFGIWKQGEPAIFEGTFPSAMITQIGKCGQITEDVSVFAQKGKPLKLITDIGISHIGNLYLHLYRKYK